MTIFKKISMHFMILTMFQLVNCIDGNKSAEFDKQDSQESTECFEYEADEDVFANVQDLKKEAPKSFSIFTWKRTAFVLGMVAAALAYQEYDYWTQYAYQSKIIGRFGCSCKTPLHKACYEEWQKKSLPSPRCYGCKIRDFYQCEVDQKRIFHAKLQDIAINDDDLCWICENSLKSSSPYTDNSCSGCSLSKIIHHLAK